MFVVFPRNLSWTTARHDVSESYYYCSSSQACLTFTLVISCPSKGMTAASGSTKLRPHGNNGDHTFYPLDFPALKNAFDLEAFYFLDLDLFYYFSDFYSSDF